MATLTEVTDADYPSETVPGIVYLDGYYFVMTPAGRIYNSAINDPTSWNALEFIQCQAETDSGIAIARIANYVVGFSQYTIEFFYDAGNPVGSPLLPMNSAQTNIGCACGQSVVNTDGTVLFIGQSKNFGRGVYMFAGTNPQKVSTPFIDRILDATDMTDVWAFVVKPEGHIFYVLVLGGDVDRTMVYDLTTQDWHEWDMLDAAGAKTVTALTQSNGIATATCASHGLSDGDLTTIAGADQTGYNGSVNITYVDANTFTYLVDPTTVTPATTATSITSTGYTKVNFAGAFASEYDGYSVIQTRSGGSVYYFKAGVYQDAGLPVDVRIRTSKLDGQSNKKKFFNSAAIVGDKVASNAYLRYSDDDYATWSNYRPVNLALDRSKVSRLGAGRRRAFELRHNANTAFRAEALEIDLKEGVA